MRLIIMFACVMLLAGCGTTGGYNHTQIAWDGMSYGETYGTQMNYQLMRPLAGSIR